MRKFIWSLVAVVTVGMSPFVNAQDPLDEMYGRAVHSFYRGDSLTAETLLNDVVTAGSQDPRVFYFRGLALARTGNSEAASADFEKGADLEISGKRVVNVGKALERIQGHARVELEKARTKARLASRAKVLEMQRTRYDAMQQQGGVATGGLVVPPSTGSVRTVPLAPNDPFNAGMTRGEQSAVETPTPVQPSVTEPSGLEPDMADPIAPADNADPFGSGAPGDSAPAEDNDPFAN